MRGAVRGSVKGCCRARLRARRSLFSLINFLPRTVPRPANFSAITFCNTTELPKATFMA